MTTPVAPQGFVLSETWWLSGSYWHEKTADDVRSALEVHDADMADADAVVRGYYASHPERLAFMPASIRKEFGL